LRRQKLIDDEDTAER